GRDVQGRAERQPDAHLGVAGGGLAPHVLRPAADLQADLDVRRRGATRRQHARRGPRPVLVAARERTVAGGHRHRLGVCAPAAWDRPPGRRRRRPRPAHRSGPQGESSGGNRGGPMMKRLPLVLSTLAAYALTAHAPQAAIAWQTATQAMPAPPAASRPAPPAPAVA